MFATKRCGRFLSRKEMIHVAFWLKVFLRPTEIRPPVFKWVDLRPAETDRRIVVRYPRSLSRGSSREGSFVLLQSFSFLIISLLGLGELACNTGGSLAYLFARSLASWEEKWALWFGIPVLGYSSILEELFLF